MPLRRVKKPSPKEGLPSPDTMMSRNIQAAINTYNEEDKGISTGPLTTRELLVVGFVHSLASGDIGIRKARQEAKDVIQMWNEQAERQGKAPPARAPYGFCIDGTGKLVPDPDEQAVLAEARKLREAGLSVGEVAVELNRLGFRARPQA